MASCVDGKGLLRWLGGYWPDGFHDALSALLMKSEGYTRSLLDGLQLLGFGGADREGSL